MKAYDLEKIWQGSLHYVMDRYGHPSMGKNANGVRVACGRILSEVRRRKKLAKKAKGAYDPTGSACA